MPDPIEPKKDDPEKKREEMPDRHATPEVEPEKKIEPNPDEAPPKQPGHGDESGHS